MVCEDCKGTGKYVGFSVVEDCKKCEGKGSLREGRVFYADKQINTGGYVTHSSVSCDLKKEDLYELGRKGPYHKYVNFPVQLTEKLSSQEGVSFGGDDGTGHSVSLARETPYDQTESPKINLPLHHKSVSFTINNAEQNAAFKELMDKYIYPRIAKSMGIPKELIENPATLPSNGVS